MSKNPETRADDFKFQAIKDPNSRIELFIDDNVHENPQNDIEILRNVCIVVYEEFREHWSDIVSLAKKRDKNRKTLAKINELQLEINKLKEKLK